MTGSGKSLLLLATTTGYQIRAFGEAADTLGVRLVFASDRCDQLEDPWWDRAIPVRFHRERESVDAIVSAFAGSRPDGILAVGDRPTILAARAAAAFGLPGNPPEAAAASRNKLASRCALRAAGLPVPWFRPLPLDADPRAIAREAPYPAVIKPLAMAGSRGVMRVDGPGELVAAFDRLRNLLRAPDVRVERDEAHEMAMVESFIPGAEFAVEGLLDQGRLRLLAVFDKPDPLDGPVFEETIYVTPSRAAAGMQRAIADAVAAAAAALGLRHGPVHAECRVDVSCAAEHQAPPAVYVLEVAGRPIGGLCSRALRFQSADVATGGLNANDSGSLQASGVTSTEVAGSLQASGVADISLEELLLRHALGEDVSGFVRERAASGVMMIPIPRRGIYRRTDGVEAGRAVPGVEDVRITAKPDSLLVPLPEGKSYLGFIFARGDEPAAVDRALREAHARLRFTIDREVPRAAG